MPIDVDTLRQAVEEAAGEFPNSAPLPIQKAPPSGKPAAESDTVSAQQKGQAG
ncbi:MAG TPA: hypothetical protein VEZ90_01930 [Blastocatellia bacterium]|nr:hypothetical protein [Blastocatellia bacterium]